MAKTVEEIYQKKTPKEHILLRPDTYIGAVDRDTQQMYVWDEAAARIVQRPVSYVPGLYKIFDEILVNAADNKIRDPRMRILAVDIRPEIGEISVFNDGQGIPIEMHAKEQVYVPELIFGHLLTSSNYDDNEKKMTGGRNGYGAKLCNIFSTHFTVETADGRKQYTQHFRNNMDITEPPVIAPRDRDTAPFGARTYTRITFRPDLRRFKMAALDADTVALLQRRVYDMCGTLRGVAVHLNGTQLPVTSFRDYVRLYLPPDEPVVYHRVSDRWELALAVADEQFAQVSFVNSIATTKGGTHVAHVVDQLIEPLTDAVRKRDKTLTVKPMHVKASMFLFINSLIENPAFDSQTKENLTLRAGSFGSQCTPVSAFVREAVRATGLVDRIASFSRAKQAAQLKKNDGAKTTRLTGIPKLEDANWAGTRRSQECTLILTEGDSAKTLAVAGLGVVGRDAYGVFPLRGKLLNVREASHQQLMANAEITNIKKILGLQHGKAYEDTAALRYGHVMIMTDQDHDGSHIKGLIINFLDHFYPSLLRVPGFLQEFITPIVRATRRNETRDFFTIPEYETFKNTAGSEWHIKYYKGLGTSTSKDAKQYFSDLAKHVKDFVPCTAEDRALIDLAFNKRKADQRKDWLAECEPGTFLDQSARQIGISDFINRELILFSMADNVRSIPSVVDGLKPGQRKVLFSCFKRRLSGEIKVAQLVGYVSEQSAYHHGEASLCATIVNLAHDFVGSNNINLLLPIGSFGSRLQGGKDAASPRYIYTSLSPLTRLLFPEHDDPVLTYQTEDNMQIEPVFYVPIIPMVLVNGADGIGTGWSTSIPNYDPRDIIANIRAQLAGQPMREMVPFYRNFRGTISLATKTSETAASIASAGTASTGASTSAGTAGALKYTVEGIHSVTAEGAIRIDELPVGTWTQTYKEYLETLIQSGAVRDYKEYHTEKTVDFLVTPLKTFPLKLTTTLSTSNMICFDPAGRIKRYASPLAIIEEFCAVRLSFYERRKQQRLATIEQELVRLENKARFIAEVIAGTLVISRRLTADIIQDLTARGYARLDDFEYLLGMKISSLTAERSQRLLDELAAKKEERRVLLGRTPADLWCIDLEAFETEYLKVVAAETKEYDQEVAKKAAKAISGARSGRAAVKTQRTAPKSKSGTTKSLGSESGTNTSMGMKVVLSGEQASKKARKSAVEVSSSDSDGPWSKYRQ